MVCLCLPCRRLLRHFPFSGARLGGTGHGKRRLRQVEVIYGDSELESTSYGDDATGAALQLEEDMMIFERHLSSVVSCTVCV